MDAITETGPTLEPALPNEHFTSETIFRRELERIFYRNWVVIAHDCELAVPGDYAAGYVADQSVFAIRGKDGEVRAFYNVCQHRGHQIVAGRGQSSRVLVCPYHAWSYETSGALRSARGAEKNHDRSTLGLKPVRIELLAGFWFVNLDPQAKPLAETFPGLETQVVTELPGIADYRLLCEGTFEISCNWKAYIENGLECYHCETAHKGFCERVDLDNYEIATHGSFTRHWGKMRAGGTYSSWKVFPTTTLRSSSDGPTIASFKVRPIDAGHCVQTVTLYGPESMAGDSDRLYRDWIDTDFFREDIALAESVQIGLNSRGFSGGLLMRSATFESEHLLADFEAWVRRAMEA